MNRRDIEFIKKAEKFIIIQDGNQHEFVTWAEAATFYNKNINTAKEIELSAVCGIVGKTLFYKYN